MIFDDVITSDPVNGTAARVTSRGYQYIPNKKIETLDSPYPIETRALEINQPQKDHSGRRFGRLTAIAPYAHKRKRWVCRCDCGTFTVRTTRAVQNTKNNDACEECRHLDYLRGKTLNANPIP